MSQELGVTQVGTFDYRAILAGDFDRVKQECVLPAGQVWLLGSVLSNTAGVVALWDAASTTPPWGVLAEDVDATAADGAGVAFLTGEFIGPRLIFKSGTWEDGQLVAREASIFFRNAALQPNQ